MATLIASIPIAFTTTDGPRQFTAQIPNNLTEINLQVQRVASAQAFPPGEIRRVLVQCAVSTDGGANFVDTDGCEMLDAIESSQEPSGAGIFLFVPKSSNRRIRFTMTCLSGALKFQVSAEAN